jgi:dTDP-3-amino-3,4,6-trideoxy-alpha-D-glucose transaminase
MKPVVLNDFKAQWQQVREDALKAIDRVGQSGWFILGDEVARFEESLATYTIRRYAVGCASGLDAIELGLRILNSQGKPVITTPLSAFATTLAIVRAGGLPIFVDTDNSGLLDLNKVEALLEANPGTQYFLLPVHLFGHSINLEHLQRLRDSFNLIVVEDCAQAIGATSGGKTVGSASDVAAISFYPTNNLGCMGDGGALLTDRDDFAKLARALRDYGQIGKYMHAFLGMNSRLDEIHAAVLARALLPRLPAFTKRRQEIASLYRRSIASEMIEVLPAPRDSNSVYHLFPILVKEDRTSLQKHLKAWGIQSAVHYPLLIPDQRALQAHSFTIEGELNNARLLANQEVSLPIHPFLSNEDVERVISACNTWRN